MQLVEDTCSVCNQVYQHGDSIDPNEGEHANYGMCVKCFSNENLYHIEVFVFCNREGHPMRGNLMSLGFYDVDPSLPDWKEIFKEHVTEDTAFMKVHSYPKNRNVKHADELLNFMSESGILAIKGKDMK